MTIEIFGGGFTNKGGELMLRTTVARLRGRQPELRIAIEPDPNTPYESRAELGLAHIFPTYGLYKPMLRRLVTRSSMAKSLMFAAQQLAMPAASQSMLGLVDRRQADGFVDISGYAFGDGFHWRKTKNAALRTASYAKRGKPVILMPQMFGPFNNAKTAGYFKQMCDHATLIYAREQVSYDAVKELLGNDERLRLAPDITIFGERIEQACDTCPQDYAVIVPNERMLDQGGKEWGDSYLPRLRAVGKQIHLRGLRPALVVHSNDPGDDRLARQLLAELQSDLGDDVPLFYTHSDPRMLKQFIAGAKFLVGSRFHSLVAALSREVPGVALGWAHKYDMLASDFGVPQLIHRGQDSPEHLLALVDELANAAKNEQLRATLREKKTEMATTAEAMWDDVFRALGLAEASAV